MDVRIKTDNCKFKYRVSGIIINDGKILVNKYGEDTYCLPGGYVNLGETSEEAINRELTEELDFEFNIDLFLGIIENFFINLMSEKTHGIDFYYKASFKNKDDIRKIDYNRVEDDHGVTVYHHFKWIDIKDLENINLLPAKIKDVIINDTKNFHYIVKD